MTFSKKHTIIPLTVILVCIFARGFFLYYMNAYPLASLCKELTIDTLQNNPFELHFNIAHPEEMGFENISTDLIPYNAQTYRTGNAWSVYKEKIQAITSDSLNQDDLLLYRLLQRHIDLQAQSEAFPYYENPLSLSGGVHNQMPILLSEYTLRSKSDIENYFKLLIQIPAYLDGIAQYALDQEKNGIFQYSGAISQVRSQCLSLFPDTLLDQNRHFLQTGFRAQLDTLTSKGILTNKEADDYMMRHTLLLKTKIVPAYHALAQKMQALKGCPEPKGLSRLPKGKEYYNLLLAASTGSGRSIPEIKDLLFDRYDFLYQAIRALPSSDIQMPKDFINLGSYKDMLAHLHQSSQTHFPSLETINEDTMQHVTLKKTDGILAEMSAPAFYLTPPIDAGNEHVIYINPTADRDPLSMYTTLAHEGFPGHLYQTTYSQNALTKAGAPLLRHLVYYGGFTEGWAVYAELYSYDFLTDFYGSPYKEYFSSIRYNRELQLCICSILDILIHYDGKTLAETEEILQMLGLNASNTETIYQTICDAPANYPKYYVGYLEILDLKETAEVLWKENYSDYAFHQWLLETGGGDFETLQLLLTEKD